MKKICFITTIPWTFRVFILKTAEYIHNNTEWDISVICDEDKTFVDELPDYIHYFPIQMKRGVSLHGINAMLEMKKVFQHEKFDLIQYSTPNASLYASLAGVLAGVPVRLYCQWGMVYVGFSGAKRWIFKQVERLICSLSTWIEPDSRSNLEFAHTEKLYSKEKGSVIWNGSACGVNLQKFDVNYKAEYRRQIREEYSIPEDAFVYGFVGRITRDKGINELLEAFKKLQDTYSNVYLLVVGSMENNSNVNEELFVWSMHNEYVIYTGYTNVVEQYFSAMDVYILPSYREGFGLGIVEAEAMGVSIIVSDIPGPTDAMLDGQTGLVVKRADVNSLLDAMERMISDPEMVKKFGEKGIEFAVQGFSQQEIFKYIVEDRKRLLGEI